MLIDRTTSWKNSWANETYIEGDDPDEGVDTRRHRPETPLNIGEDGKLDIFGKDLNKGRKGTRKTDGMGELLGEELPRRLDFKTRSFCNKTWWVCYKMLKMIYNGPYFYFIPTFTWLVAFEGIILHEDPNAPVIPTTSDWIGM